jgi:hypothetical protein
MRLKSGVALELYEPNERNKIMAELAKEIRVKFESATESGPSSGPSDDLATFKYTRENNITRLVTVLN